MFDPLYLMNLLYPVLFIVAIQKLLPEALRVFIECILLIGVNKLFRGKVTFVNDA